LLNAFAPKEFGPAFYAIACKKRRSVKQALTNERWLHHLAHGLLSDMLPELLRLASLLNGVGLREELLDSILRRFTGRTFGKIGIHALVQRLHTL
jgi:hypothetical protein